MTRLRHYSNVSIVIDPLSNYRFYRQETFGNGGPYDGKDIAVLRLSNPMAFTDMIMPACLPSLGNEKLGLVNEKPLTLAGFGQSNNGAPGARRVLQASLVIRLTCCQQLSCSFLGVY